MEQQSKTEHLITKINYRKHKQKLNEIKNHGNNTSLQFYSSGKARPLDRKKIMMMKLKREEIEQENQHLRRKIEKINGNGTQDGWKRKIASESQHRRASHSVAHNLAEPKRDRYAQEEGMEVTSDCGDGDNIKCFVPAIRGKIKYASTSQSKASDYNAIIFNLRQKEKKDQVKDTDQIQLPNNPQGAQRNSRVVPDKSPSIVALEANPKVKQLIRESTALNRDDLVYNEPQKEAHRLVLFKKTKIPYPMVSFLIEISLIDKQILITAYGMGIVSQDYKMLVSRKRSKELLEELKNNFETLWERVIVDVDTGIRISGFVDEDDISHKIIDQMPQPQRQKQKQQKRFEITQDFLQRNYYTLLKQSSKQKPDDSLTSNKINLVKPAHLPVSTPSNNVNVNVNKPRSLFRNKIQYAREKVENNNAIDEKKKDKQKEKQKEKEKKRSNSNLALAKQKNDKIQPKKQNVTTSKKLQNKSQVQQDEYAQQFEQSKKEEGQSQYKEDYQQIEQLQSNPNPSTLKHAPKNKSKLTNKSHNMEEEYQQSFEPQNQPEQYSMEYDSNPSKVMNNKSSIHAVKKKTINNNKSHVSGGFVEEEVEDHPQEAGVDEYVEEFDN